MAARCKLFINFCKLFLNKYDWQTKNTREVIDVKEEIWITNVKYFCLSFNTS